MPGQSATRTEPASRLPTDRITCPVGRRFRKGHEDTVPHEDISVCDRIMDETPATPWHPPGDAGEPQDLRRLQPSSGITRLGLVFIRNLTLATAKIMMMMLEILKRMLHNLIGTMYD